MEHRGKTDKALIHEHRATWDYVKELPVRLTIDKTQTLEECYIHFEILQEYHDGGRGGRVLLGNVKLNLAEYTRLPNPSRSDTPEDDEGGITRRYLLQDSKVNSTLKVGIKMTQTEGDTNFIAPPLRSAMVIGGIAGVLSTEAGEGEDIPSITSKTKELSEAQDIYRRTLAATWACQAGELPPDKLIEDLFNGGDGGRMQPPPTSARQEAAAKDDNGVGIDTEPKRPVTPGHLTPRTGTGTGHRRRGSGDSANAPLSHASTGSGRSSIEQQMQHSPHEHRRHNEADFKELTEFDLREDLRSWQVRVR